MKNRTPPSLRASALAAALATTVLIGCNPAPESAPAAPPTVTLGTQIDDTVITAKIKSALLADPDVKGLDLQVQTRNGNVQLSGFVDSQAQIDQALALARGVAGVVAVEPGITLRGPTGTSGNMVDDLAVTTRVKTALLAEPAIRSLDISVLTVNGVVQLTGFVDNRDQIDQASAIAQAAEGAGSVKNELAIKR